MRSFHFWKTLSITVRRLTTMTPATTASRSPIFPHEHPAAGQPPEPFPVQAQFLHQNIFRTRHSPARIRTYPSGKWRTLPHGKNPALLPAAHPAGFPSPFPFPLLCCLLSDCRSQDPMVSGRKRIKSSPLLQPDYKGQWAPARCLSE